METLKTKALVLGGGPAGYAAAIRLGQLGVECVLVEERKVGGTCLNVGCIPSKSLLHASAAYKNAKREMSVMGIQIEGLALDWGKAIGWKDDLVKKLVGGIGALLKHNRVRLVEGKGFLLDAHRVKVGETVVEFEAMILATGSAIIELPAFPFSAKHIVNSTDLLSMTEIPGSMAILGGGIIGMEMATIYSSVGTEVTVIEMADRTLPSYEREAVRLVEKSLKSNGAKILCDAQAVGYEEKGGEGVLLHYERRGERKTIECDKLAVAVGRRPNLDGMNFEVLGIELDGGRIPVNDKLQTRHPHVHAAGDLIDGPMLAHKATAEGVLAAEALAGEKVSRDDIHVIPDVVYTKPEIASVGINEDQARERNLEVRIGKFPLKALGRSFTTNEVEGYVKYIGDKKTEELLGCTIVSNRASDLIAEAALAYEMKARLDDVALTVHPHPSFSEGHMEAAAAALGKAVHILN